MPSWQKLVADRLAGMALDAEDKAELEAELAAHLDDSFEAFCRQGLHEREAAYRTLGQIGDWQNLRRGVFAAKRREHQMKKRVEQLWVPGFLILALSMAGVWALHALGFQARIISWRAPGTILFDAPWLLSLPFLGALGSHISTRAGGSRGTALLVSIFPALALALAFLLMFPIGMTIEGTTGRPIDFASVATILLRDGIGWLVLPGTALFLGGLLVQLIFCRQSCEPAEMIGQRG